MDVQKLKTPIVTDDSIRFVNFFNGRLLSGEDLTQEQDANHAYQQLLGRAIGEGVVYGLEVTRNTTTSSVNGSPVISIAPGLAINRTGRMLQVGEKIDLALTYELTGTTGANVSFGPCDTGQPGIQMTTTAVYLLMIAPAEVGKGRAPVSGLGNIDAGCNTRYNVEGVSFRIIDLSISEVNQPALLRNLLTYRCLGLPDLSSPNAVLNDPLLRFASDPYGSVIEQVGLLDKLRQTGDITACDVPLAAIFWQPTSGIRFIDLWSVRRRPTAPPATGRWNPLNAVLPTSSALDGTWRVLTADRTLAEAEARFLQFQDQLRDLLAMPNAETNSSPSLTASQIVARDRFNYLPPFGIVPIQPPTTLTPSTGAKVAGFDKDTFFRNMNVTTPASLESISLRSLYLDSLQVPPIVLAESESIQLYYVWENVKAIKNSTQPLTQLVVVFASKHLPYRGVARYDEAHWNTDQFS